MDSAAAPTIAFVEIWIDGRRKRRDVRTPYTYRWNAGRRNDGFHDIQARAYLKTGQTVDSAVVTVQVDTSPPTLEILSPAPGSTITGAPE